MTDEARQLGDDEHKDEAAVQAPEYRSGADGATVTDAEAQPQPEQDSADSAEAQGEGEGLDFRSPETVEAETGTITEQRNQIAETGASPHETDTDEAEGDEGDGNKVGIEKGEDYGDEGEDEEEEEEEEAEDDDADEEEEEEDDEEDDEPRLKYARLTPQLNSIYRNGDATSTFLVAGDKMVSTA